MEKDNDKRRKSEESLWEGSESNPKNRPTRPKEVKCPKCNADITYLRAFCFEQNRYRVELDEHDGLDWSVSETIESSETKTEFTCPECDEILFTTQDSAYPQAVIDFLSKGRTDPLRSKKRQIDEYLSSKDPTDYGAIPIGGDAYDTAGLIVIRLDEHGLRLSDGTVTEDVSDKSVAEIIETIEDWAQTLREGAE